MPVNLDQKYPHNPYRRNPFTTRDFLDQRERELHDAPGLTAAALDRLVREAWAQGRAKGFEDGEARNATAFDEGYRQGRHDGQIETVDALKNYETNAIFNVLLDSIAERRKSCNTKREKDHLKWLNDQISKIADRIDDVRREYGA